MPALLFIQGQGLTEVIKEQDSSSSSLTDNDCWQIPVRGNYQHGNTVIKRKRNKQKSLTGQLNIQTQKIDLILLIKYCALDTK